MKQGAAALLLVCRALPAALGVPAASARGWSAAAARAVSLERLRGRTRAAARARCVLLMLVCAAVCAAGGRTTEGDN